MRGDESQPARQMPVSVSPTISRVAPQKSTNKDSASTTFLGIVHLIVQMTVLRRRKDGAQ